MTGVQEFLFIGNELWILFLVLELSGPGDILHVAVMLE